MQVISLLDQIFDLTPTFYRHGSNQGIGGMGLVKK
jgi:hypothetical protein